MSGAELIAVLGVAASAAQLIDCSLKLIRMISDIYNRAKDADDRLVRYTSQIYQILEVGRAIQDNPNLQSPLIHNQLQSTLAQVRQLDQALTIIRRDYTTGSSRKRVWKAIVGNKERRILASFETLEKEKIALTLCIVVVLHQSQQRIEGGIEILVDKDMGVSELIEKFNLKSSKNKEDPAISGPKKQTTTMPKSNSGLPRDPPKSGLPSEGSKQGQSQQTQQGIATYNNMNASEETSQYNGEYGDDEYTDSYEGPDASHTAASSTGQAFQLNGNYGGSGTHQHQGARATGSSIQINGNVRKGTTEARIKQNAKKEVKQVSGV